MSIFVNRTLNLKRIKAIGFDMDYTLVRYNTEAFEGLTHKEVLKKLVASKKYPKAILELSFDFNRAIQGLVIDKKNGMLLKVSRFGKVKQAVFGLKTLNYREQEDIYRNRVIDLNSDHIQSIDTSFAISNGVLYGQLIELKKNGIDIPDYQTLADDVKDAIDLCHSDGTLKQAVRDDITKFIIQDPEVVEVLERYKRYGKKVLVITNSDYDYTKLLLDHTINPYLKEHKDWSELFEVVITSSRKPRFFTVRDNFLKVDPKTSSMTNLIGPIEKNGIYQGGWAGQLQEYLGLEGDEILYLGDHIYGDVVSIKKTFNWRTALVLDPLKEEIDSITKSAPVQAKIDELMTEKEQLENELNTLDLKRKETDENVDKKEIDKLFSKIEKINGSISELLDEYKSNFNSYWGEMMRAGQEESRFADQVEKYACIYMSKVSDLKSYSPKTYFRPVRRVLPHELV